MKNQILFLLAFPLLTFSQVQIGQDIDGESEFDNSGWSVSISSSGNHVAIGARSANNFDNSIFHGHVRVYENIAGNWQQIGQDLDGLNQSDYMGFSTAISADGSIVAVGADGYNGNNLPNTGLIRVFQNIANVWTQLGNDIYGELDNDYFGFSVDITPDGLTLVASSVYPTKSSVRVFKYETGSWNQVGQTLYATVGSDWFGNSVSISDDGNIIAVGAKYNDEGGPDKGQVRVFQNISNVWTQIGQNLNGAPNNSTEETYKYGGSVSLSSDGSILAVGIPDYGLISAGYYQGKVIIYQNVNGVWTQLGQEIIGAINDKYCGTSVSLSSNGLVVAMGAEFSNGSAPNSGRTRVFQYVGNTWEQAGVDMNGEAFNDASGRSVSISSDGSKVAIGAYYNDGNGTDAGHVRVYDLSSVLNTENFEQNSFSVYPNPAKDFLVIENLTNETISSVEIYNLTGKLVKNEILNFSTINIEDLAKGIYLLRIKTENKIINQKFIKE